ncbi:MAG: hypothetical protein GX781_10155, partial [Clostridiales bacterium]|nr:hypothetical protein [Clostridiales bacterium]
NKLGVFIDSNGKLKNVLIIKAFSLSFLFVIIIALGYLISAGFISERLPEDTADFIGVWGPSALIAIFATLLCSALMFVFEDKIIVPVAFLFVALYYFIIVIGTFLSYQADIRSAGVRLVNIYALPPALFGNLISWSLFAGLARIKPKRKK